MNILELTQKLISIPSVSYHEKALAEYISELLREKNIPHTLDYYNPGKFLNSKMDDTANVYAEVGNGEKILILYAHIDVVNAPENLFIPKIENGKLFGRGASDMKSGLATLLLILLNDYEKLKNANKKIIFTFIADEENSATGVRRFLQWANHIDMTKAKVILTEPSDNYTKIEVGGRGYAFLDISGKATEVMKTLYAIFEAKHELLKQYPDIEDGFGASTLEITKVYGKNILKNGEKILGKTCHASMPMHGVNPVEKALTNFSDITFMHSSDDCSANSISSEVVISRDEKYNEEKLYAHIDIRTNRAASKDDHLLNQVKKLIAQKVQVQIRDHGHAFYNEDESLVKICTEGQSCVPEEKIAMGGSDAPYFGDYTKSIISGFGPGMLGCCHMDDESIEISELEKSPSIMRKVIENYLS